MQNSLYQQPAEQSPGGRRGNEEGSLRARATKFMQNRHFKKKKKQPNIAEGQEISRSSSNSQHSALQLEGSLQPCSHHTSQGAFDMGS